MDAKYTPVDPDFYDIIKNEADQETDLKIHYFDQQDQLYSAQGVIENVVKQVAIEWLQLKNGEKIRLDYIITLNGKPGPAFDQYDSYANACFSCLGGMDDD